MNNPFKDELNELCHDRTGLSLHELLDVIGEFEKLRKLFDTSALYTQRAIGLANSTSKEDPLDCPYVLKSLKEMITTNKDELDKALSGVRQAAQVVEGLIGKL